MSTGPQLSLMYLSTQQYYNTPLIIAQQQQYDYHQGQEQQQQEQQQEQKTYFNKYPPPPSSPLYHHDQMMSQAINYDDNIGQHNNNNRQQSHFRVLSPPLSVASSSTSSSNTSNQSIYAHNTTRSANTKANINLTLPTQLPRTNVLVNNNTSQQIRQQQRPTWNFTWLVFLNEKWVPFDIVNQTKLEQTLTVGGTFVDIIDTHFPEVNRVRVFPRNNYLSYLGVKYRLSRIMQPDAYLDHAAVAEAKQPTTSPPSSNFHDSVIMDRNKRVWEM